MVPDQSRAERTTSYAAADFPRPTGREEDWRFTPVDRIGDLFEVAPADEARIAVHVEAPGQVTVTTAPHTGGVSPLGVGHPGDRAAAVAWEAAGVVTTVTVPAEAELTAPVRVDITASDLARVNGHLAIDAGRHSKAVVVLSHKGSAHCGANIEVRVGDGADLTVVTLQEWDDDTVHLAQHDALVGRDARVRHIAVTLGGKVVRISTNVRYAGPGGDVERLGVYFADAGQHQEHRLFVDHEPANCTSNVDVQGRPAGRRRAHGLDRRRPHPGRGRGHRHLRAQPQPRPDRGRAGRLGAQPGDRDRRDRRRRPRERDRPVRRRAAVLPAGPAASPRTTARRLVVRGFFATVVSRIGIPEISGTS